MLNVMIVDDFRVFITQLKKLDVWKRYSDTFELKYTLTDSHRALDILRREHIDILITDIKMPKLSGIDLLRYVSREKLCGCSILMSEYTEFEFAHEAIILGAFDYLVKPVSDAMLTPILERAAKYLSEHSGKADDDLVNSSIEAVYQSVINGSGNFPDKIHTLTAACTKQSGENLMRYGSILGNAAEAVYNKVNEKYPWIGNIVSSPEKLRSVLLQSDDKEASEGLFADFCNDMFTAVKTYYPQGMTELTRSIAEYILMNRSRKLTLSDVADKCFVNKTHLSHIFKVNTGISFVDYIVRYKMQMLRLLISESEMTLSEMADELGYDDCKYMSRLFKNTYGMTVSEYKKEYCRNQH